MRRKLWIGLLLVLLAACSEQSEEIAAVSPSADVGSADIAPLQLQEGHQADYSWPFPCNGAIAFQRVDTPTEANWLTDTQHRFGAPGAYYPVSDFIRHEPLVGSLSDDGVPDQRYFLIGAYEITEMQQKALRAPGNCSGIDWSAPSPAVSNASWFDAVDFTRAYTEWLGREHPDVLAGGFGAGPAFIRLPTEAEWEYAARGGSDVKVVEELQARLFPMPDGFDAYVWHADQQSCNGVVRMPGLKKPNPAGLYDVLGNVSEIVFEPFRLNAGGRLHGQAGGFITRGGSCVTSASDITTALRNEHDFYAGTERRTNRPAATGFRIAVASVAQSDSRISILRDDFDRLSAFPGEAQIEQKVAGLNHLQQDEPVSEEVRNALADVSADFDQEMARRNRIERRSIQSALRSGALAVRAYRSDYEDLYLRFKDACEQSKVDPTLDRTGRFCELFEQAESALGMTRSIYVSLVVQTAEDFSAEDLNNQFNLALSPIDVAPNVDSFMSVFKCHVERYRENPSEDWDLYFDEIRAAKVVNCD